MPQVKPFAPDVSVFTNPNRPGRLVAPHDAGCPSPPQRPHPAPTNWRM